MKLALVLEATAKMDGIKRANQQLKDLQRQVGKLQPMLKMARSALISLGGMGYAFYRLVDAAHKLGEEVTRLAEATGGSATDLQVLGRVAAQNGAKLEDMSKAVLKLTKSTQDAANGNKGLADRFARLGIDLEKFKGLAPERQMERLGLAVNTARDKQAALADIMALVGTDAAPRLMQSLKALGEQGYDQLKEKVVNAGEVMSEEAIASAARIDQSLSDLGHRFKLFAANWAEGAMLIYDTYIKTDEFGTKAAEAMKLSARSGGINNPEAVKAALEAADAAMREGSDRMARYWVQQSEAWVENMKGLLEKTPRLPWAEIVRDYDRLQAQLTRADERRAKRKAEIEAVAAETARVQQAAAVKAAEDAVAAELAVIEAEQQKVAEQTLNIHRAHARQRAQAEEQARKEVEKSVEQTREALARLEFDLLAPSEQLKQQTEEFWGRVQELHAQALLSTEELARAQGVYNAKMGEAAALGKEEARQQALKDMTDLARGLNDAFEQIGPTIEDKVGATITEFVETGTADLKKMGQAILKDVIASMMKALIIKGLLSGVTRFFGGGLASLGGAAGGAGGLLGGLAGARASGGPVRGRSTYLVGERGPELFMPQVSGQIIDANRTAAALAGDTATGGSSTHNVYQIDARGADAGAVQRLEAALMKLAGPGVVEKRARAAETDFARRR